MRYALDANAVILLLTGHPRMVERVSACDEGDLAMSSIVYAEVAMGTERGKPPSADTLSNLSRIVTLLPFDEAAALVYARLPFKRGSFDRLIAAHAIATGLVLITANVADFADIPGLRVEDWTS